MTALLLLALSVLVVVTTMIGSGSEFALLATVLFALTAPGWAIVAFWRPASGALEWALAVSTSIAVTIVVAMTMLVTSVWSPAPVMIVLAAATALTLGYHLLRTNLVDWPAS